MLPFIEQAPLYDQFGTAQAGYPAWGPVPWYGWNFPPHAAQVPGLLCPSDKARRPPRILIPTMGTPTMSSTTVIGRP